MAERRAAEALKRLRKGEKIARREAKLPYNGAEGVPIREEVLLRDRDEVITRNAYGAQCLNTPQALFADIDFTPRESGALGFGVFIVLAMLTAVLSFWLNSWLVALMLSALTLVLTVSLPPLLARVALTMRGGADVLFDKRLARFLQTHPDWAIRVYRTPAGMRLLATHRPFDADEPAVTEFFRAMHVDPVYALMCRNQKCFRARLSAKPWRIGITDHMKPQPGVWPVHPERMAQRNSWITRYEAIAADFAACHFVEALGSGMVHEAVRGALELHDARSGALVPDKPLA